MCGVGVLRVWPLGTSADRGLALADVLRPDLHLGGKEPDFQLEFFGFPTRPHRKCTSFSLGWSSADWRLTVFDGMHHLTLGAGCLVCALSIRLLLVDHGVLLSRRGSALCRFSFRFRPAGIASSMFLLELASLVAMYAVGMHPATSGSSSGLGWLYPRR